MSRRAANWPARAMVLVLLVLGACSQAPNPFAAVNQGSGGASGGVTGPQAAVGHSFTLSLPNSEIEALQQKHLAECIRLGGSVSSASVDRLTGGIVRARAKLRIKPESYDVFAAMLAAPPATVTFHSQTAEDLSGPVLDVERRLAAKTTLRERLTALLNDPGKKTAADLIMLEKGLSDVQADIESLTAQRDDLRKRVDWLNISIAYQSSGGRFRNIDLSPLQDAFNSIGQTMIHSLAALVWFLAAAGPWVPIIALARWAIRRLVRGLRSRETRKLEGRVV